ncbi:MAG TPA: hypothetical protein VJN88_10705 [Ktedonobacterales bacterium]|nr:hypothetical protein [Ktedonobacterales bacterium]
MFETTAVETEKKSSVLTRVGLIVLVLGIIALAIPLGDLLYANINGNVTLATADAINSLLTIGVILTVVAAVLGLIAVGLHVPGLLGSPRRGLVGEILAVLLLVGSAAFLFTTMLPRAQAVQRVNDKLAPFGTSLATNCQNTIAQAQADLKNAQLDAQNMADLGDDKTYTKLMQTDIAALQADGTALTNGLTALNKLTSPDSKYNDLLAGCKKDVTSEIAVVNNKGIPLGAAATPAEASALVTQLVSAGLTQTQATAIVGSLGTFIASNPNTDAVGLLQISVAAVGPAQPLGPLPAGFAEGFTAQILATVNAANTDPTLTNEGNQLKSDIQSILNKNLAPFVVTVPIG